MRVFALPAAAAAVVLATTGLDQPALVTGVVLVALIAAAVIRDACRPAP